jgi:hypothetical protein
VQQVGLLAPERTLSSCSCLGDPFPLAEHLKRTTCPTLRHRSPDDPEPAPLPRMSATDNVLKRWSGVGSGEGGLCEAVSVTTSTLIGDARI